MPFIADRIFGWKPLNIDSSWGLQTVKSGTAYALCNSLYCTDCHLLFLDMRFTDDEVARLYRGYRGNEYVALREKYEPGYTVRNQELNKQVGYMNQTEDFLLQYIPPPKTILDWGGNDGTNTPLSGRAQKVEIYDINNCDDENAENNQYKRYVSGDKFELITCCNVLEHVPYPVTLLKEVRKYMDVTSFLFIEVPHETVQVLGLAGNGTKRHWHEHINFFSKDSLVNMVRNASLDLVAIRSIPTFETGNQSHVFQIVCRL